ncbi:LysE family translocator [Maridesulfovibrio zosterae]|uniref:LysE family translocator n=1 Tax=Maridesulfovibrio zosterae TaxID=82171 RepID=UPI00040FF544|nr:LysE family translocator [Maridesulfovibrio zosterae]
MQDNFWPFFIFAIVMVGTPGPANLASMALGQSVGFKRSIPFLAGAVTGGMLTDILVFMGLGELFESSPVLAGIFRIAGVIYILYLAVKILRMHELSPTEKPAFKFTEGLLVHPLNPKCYAMAISAFSQFVDPSAPRFFEVVIFAATFTCCAAFFQSLWCVAGETFMKMLSSKAVLYSVNISMVVLMVGATFYALYQ